MEAAPSSAVPPVPEMAKPGTNTQGPKNWEWVEASVWTDRMLAALVNGVQGGKWYSLMDKVVAPSTLQAAWRRVAANRGAAGVDGVSILRFKARANTTWRNWRGSCDKAATNPYLPGACISPKAKGKPDP